MGATIHPENIRRALRLLRDMETKRASGELAVYAEGPCTASVCSSLPMADVQVRMRARETGVASKWEWAEAEQFGTGEPNPCPCSRNPKTHRHYLFHC